MSHGAKVHSAYLRPTGHIKDVVVVLYYHHTPPTYHKRGAPLCANALHLRGDDSTELCDFSLSTTNALRYGG
eukprot:scaffold1131_cov161-Amphora_coffeaeformis.AAC.6